jgi:hypothetical protein
MFIYEGSKKIFDYGINNYSASRDAASCCGSFKEDDEDEQVDSVLVSCYNCIYRRWKKDTFECMKRETE